MEARARAAKPHFPEGENLSCWSSAAGGVGKVAGVRSGWASGWQVVGNGSIVVHACQRFVHAWSAILIHAGGGARSEGTGVLPLLTPALPRAPALECSAVE